WPTELRAKAIAIVQSSWAIGYAFAALVAGIVLHYADWRMVFFVGILPALVTLWIQKGVPESEMWRAHRAKTVALADGEATLRQPRLGSRSSRTKNVFYSVYIPGCSSSSALCHGQSAFGSTRSGNDCCFFWHRLFFRIRNYWQRNFSHQRARPRAGLHLQRRPHHEFSRALRDRARRPSQRIELGLLFMRPVIFARMRGCDAIARDEREAVGVNPISRPARSA